MKKILIKFLFAAILVLFRLSLPAQNTPTPTRMERDMKIFSTMLDEYMEKSIGKNNMFNNNTKIEYLDGFGVLVNVVCGKNLETRGEIWINNKLEKLENGLGKLENGLERIDKIFVEPNMRVRTNSGNVKVRTTTKNGRTTIITNDNGRITTQEFDENDRNNRNHNHNKDNHNKDNNDNHNYKFDYQETKEEQKRAKADLKRAKKDFERSQKDLEINQKELAKMQKDAEKELKDNDKSLKKEMKEVEKEMKEIEKDMKDAEKELKEAEKEMQKAEKEMQQEMAISQAKEDSANKVNDAKTEEVIREFLVQYADLITELKPNERIRIVYSDVQGTSFFSGDNYGTIQIDGKSNPKGLEVFKSDIDNFKSSKNEQNFKARIRQIAPTKAKESLKVDMLSAIFDKVLADAKSENIKIQGKTQVTYLEDYSIKYDSRIYLKNQKYSFDFEDANTKNKDNDPKQAQQDETIVKEQSLIEKNGKEYFVLYGKTAASELKANEKLIWEIDFGDRNKNPKILKKIIFYISKSVLEDFDSRKITLEQAMAQVKTEKK